MQSFHDWYLVGVAVNMDTHELTLRLRDDYKTHCATLAFTGATRFVVEGFIAQNVIYGLEVFHDLNSIQYRSAREKLEKAHPWGEFWSTKKIAQITASLGAEVLVEFDQMQAVELESER